MHAALPPSLHWLFWEVDPTSVDVVAHQDYVIERLMSRGDWEAMRWLGATYPREVLADFLERKGQRLAPRELAYWSFFVGRDHQPSRGGARPQWSRR